MDATRTDMAAVLSGVDEAVRPQDDLFRYVNGTWLRETPIPDDLPTAGSFIDLVVQAEKDVAAIIANLESPEALEALPEETREEARKIGQIYRSWMDEVRLEERGLAGLESDLHLVEEATTKSELASALGSLQRTGVSTFFGLGVDADINDPNRNILEMWQSGLTLPDEAYYREPQYAEIVEKFKDFLLTYPQYFGWSYEECQARAKVIFTLEEKIASHHMSVVDSRDTDKINNPMTWADFVASTPGFEWDEAMSAAGFTTAQLTEVNVFSPQPLCEAAKIWESTSLEDLKTYTFWRIFVARGSYLTHDIDATSFDFFGRTLSGTPTQRERWKRGVQLINGSLGEAVGKIYVATHFPPEHKAKMDVLVADLLEAYRRAIRSLEWMGEDTKKKALAKVDTFAPKIGYPEKWIDYSALSASEELLENIRAINAFEFDRSRAKLGTPVDRTEWYMTPQTVNAYYNPVWNEIVFPAAILQFPFFDPERDPALNYGGIGAVIGHEIGHGFDDQGSKYDADGTLRNWWTQSDRSEFEKRTAALVGQFDAYIPVQFGADSPHHVQGALTLGENIGDLGGLTIALKAYEIYLEREGLNLKEAPVLDGFTGEQRIFLSYARVWQGKVRDELLTTRIATDPHSPQEFRCNGTVKNVDAFAHAFDVREGDELYLAPHERVHIWG